VVRDHISMLHRLLKRNTFINGQISCVDAAIDHCDSCNCVTGYQDLPEEEKLSDVQLQAVFLSERDASDAL